MSSKVMKIGYVNTDSSMLVGNKTAQNASLHNKQNSTKCRSIQNEFHKNVTTIIKLMQKMQPKSKTHTKL
jgi:hypothetical protein